jgi:hypothetical protein
VIGNLVMERAMARAGVRLLFLFREEQLKQGHDGCRCSDCGECQ